MSEPEYAGCASAFVEALAGELDTASRFLKRLEGSAKGAAFAYEISFDRGRYGALVVLDRWRHFHASLEREERAAEAGQRVTAGETILSRANALIDAADGYHAEVVAAVLLAFDQVRRLFRDEIELSEKAARLGPLAPEEQRDARAAFLAELARR